MKISGNCDGTWVGVMLRAMCFSNYFSPYRDSLWSALAEVLPLEVRLARDGDAGRGWELTDTSTSAYPVSVCNIRSTNWPIEDFWLPNKQWLDLKDSAGVILGGWEAPAYWSVACEAKRAGIRRVGFYESTPETQVYQTGPIAKYRSKWFSSLDAVVTPGSGATDALLQMGVKPEKIFQGFNVVDHSYWHQKSLDREAQQNRQLGHSYLYVGQLIERKGISDLISAFLECSQPYDTLRIVGKGPLHTNLQALIASLDLQGSVSLVGAKSGSDLAGEYSSAQTLVLSSHKEVWGLVINEALASGLHVVAGENCGSVRDVRNMVGVFVFEESSEDRISKIAHQMRLSRNTWSNWIREPEILKKTPSDFALVFKDALVGSGS